MSDRHVERRRPHSCWREIWFDWSLLFFFVALGLFIIGVYVGESAR